MTLKVELNSDTSGRLFGVYDRNVKLIENRLGVKIDARDGGIAITGAADAAETAVRFVGELLEVLAQKKELSVGDVERYLDMLLDGKMEDRFALEEEVVTYSAKGRPIKCKTVGQLDYVRAIRTHGLVFGIGPAGTGKTYLAVATAAAAYKRGEVERIVLTRPAIEAGEKLGFLPGDLQTKVDPYLRPLYDALADTFGLDAQTKLIERGTVEVAPLAYMRGRTLSGAFIILDEAQNTTPEQMKMFLTRIGEGSRAVVTGDVTQVDLPPDKLSGLMDALNVLNGVEGIAAVKLTERDVVRSDLVRRIVAAYDKVEATRRTKR